MSGLRGDIGKLRALEKSLRALPLTVAHKVAAASAGTITSLARATFSAGENAYGDTWDPGKKGERVRLQRSGKLASGVELIAIGTRLRSRLGPRYAIYQIGRRPVFPRNGARLPVDYVEALSVVTSAVIRAELGTGGPLL